MQKSLLIKLSTLALTVCSLLCIGTACKEEHTHSYTETITAPTCTEQGFTTYSCECGESYVDTYVNALGHEFTNYVSDNNATCTENGTETASCNHIGCQLVDTRIKENSALGHEFTDYVSDNNATCTENGTETASCNHTGCQLTDTRTKENSALGHEFTDYISDNNATCTENGTETARCNHTGCQETDMRTKENSMLVHTYNQEVVEEKYLKDESTCTSKAVYYKSCICGVIGSETFEYDEAKGHSFNDTWTYDATYHWRASNCGHIDEISDKQEHSYGAGNTCFCGYVNTTCYIVLWKNYDESILEIDENVPFSTTPTYNGNTPTKEGNEQYTYMFSGWSPTISRVTDDIVYIAQFVETINQYTIIWQNYDGTVLETDSVDYGTMPVYNGTTPTRDNSGLSYAYQFSGWEPTVSAVTGDCVYVAQFIEQQLSRYTVNYDANGGTGAPSTQTKYKSSNLKLSSTVPTREGYTFMGWNNLYEETVYQAGDTFTSNFNVTMFAMWAETCEDCDGEGTITSTWSCQFCDGAGRRRQCNSCGSYSIKQVIGQGYSYYQCNSCASISTSTSTCNWCDGEGRGTTTNTCSDCKGLTYIKPVAPTTQSIAARSITLTKIDGYEYKIEGGEWQSSNVFENLKYSTTYTFYQRKATEDGMPFGVTSVALTVSTQTTTLYYIEYELADGQNNFSNPTSYYSTGNNITLKTPTKEHYDFAGWLYNGDIVTEINASWCSDITLTATWTPTKYVITYELDGGASENVLFYTIETETFTLIVPQKEGYTFLGWTGANSETVSLTVTIPKGSYGELSYTAHWSINQYTISFVAKNGQVFDSITQDYNTAITLPKPTWTERSFVGWFDESSNEQFTRETMPAENVTLYGKWINYEVFLCVDNLTGLSVYGDATDGATYNVTAVDTDNNPVKVTAQLLSGSQTAGTSITVRFVANGLYGAYAMQMVSDIKVYGMPTIQYDTQKDYINASDSLVASLFTAIATNTYGEQLLVNVSIKETEYSAGDTITLILSATDITGNTTIVEIENVKYYGTPTIIRDETVTEIKASDTIGNQLFGVFATDSFGEALTVTTVKESGTFAGGYTITIKSSATDSKGNSAYITYNVKVYGLPTITSAVKTNFKEGEEINLSTLGIVAKDSFGNALENVTLSLTDGTNAAGNMLTYLVTAIDHLGNVNTKTISVKVYGTPTITYDTNKTAIKATDKISASLLSATAKDSFGNSLTVTATLENGEIKGGSCISVKLVATDRVGNTYSIITDEIKVYAQGDIKLTYNAALSNNIKKTSCGEEFNAIATDTFGEACTITIQPASGYFLTGGATINLYLVATDKAGNTYTSEIITEKNVYDIPTLSYAREYDYIFANDNPYLLFSVKDSFGADRLFNVEIVSGSLQELGIIVYRITAEDKMGNKLDCTYSLPVTEYDENGFLVCEQDGVIILIDYSSTNEIVVPNGVQAFAKELFTNDTNISSIVLPDSLKELGANAFSGCSNLTSIEIPDSVTSIGENAFYNCSSLISVYITDVKAWCGISGLYNLMNYGLSDKKLYLNDEIITKLVIPDGVASVPAYAFYGCSNLTSVVIGDSVTSIGQYAFYGCSSLTEMTIPFVGASKNGTNNKHFGYIFGASSYSYHYDYVPSSLKKVTVTGGAIGSYAFYECYSLTSVEIGDSVTSIGYDAFDGCSNLTSVVIGDSVTSIGQYAFYGCSSLTSVEIGDSVTSIGENAFYGCSNLTSVVIGDGVTSIGEKAFYNCSSLTEMTIPFVGASKNGTNNKHFGYIFGASSYSYNHNYVPTPLKKVTITAGSIGSYAFRGCSSLTSVVIGDGVTSIGYDAFYECYSLTSVEIGDSVTSIGSDAFYNCSSLTSVVIGDSVTSIGYDAFYNCSDLTSIVIGDSVTSIGSDAFYNCSDLTSVVIGDSVTSIGENAFYGCSSLTEMTIPFVGASKNGTNNTHFGYIFGASSYSYNYNYVPSSLKKVTVTGGAIGSYAFYECYSLTSVVIGDGVTSIGERAFYNCSGLTSVVIGDSVTSIGQYAFYGCSSLTSVVIGDSVTSIRYDAFFNCSSLTNIIIPDSVTSIGSSAFRNCSSLTSITIPDSVTSIGSSAFYGCSSLLYNVKGNLKYLGNENNPYLYLADTTFTNITNAIIDENCKLIGSSAFDGCSSLTSIVIPDSVTSIGDYTFYNCSSLTSIEIPDSVTSIGSSAFYGCDSLTSVEIGDSVTSIGSSAFDGCSSLTSIVIPDSVTSIGSSAFYGCSSLLYNVKGNLKYLGNENNPYLYLADTTFTNITNAIIDENCKLIGSSAFDGCSSLTSIVIPDSVTSIGIYAFYNCSSLTSITFRDTSTWYRTTSNSNWSNKTNGTSTSVTASSSNAAYFKSTYYNYYWYKL